MIHIENLVKRYGDLIALDHLNLDIKEGEIFGLLGPNGAGKSTIIKCIAGLLRFQGSITLDGLDNKSLEAKRLLGYIPEMPAVYDLLTVEEHLEFIRRAYRMSDDGYGQALLERFELWDKKDKLGKARNKGCYQNRLKHSAAAVSLLKGRTDNQEKQHIVYVMFIACMAQNMGKKPQICKRIGK